jgi:hypothetical protein
LVGQTALDSTLEAGHRAGKPLGQALRDAGLLREEQLSWALAEQRARRLSTLLAFREGDLYFVDDAQCGEGAPELVSSPTLLVASAVREAYSVSELGELLSGLQSEYGVLAPPLDCRPILHLQRGLLGLTAEETRAFDRAASGVSPSQILKQARSQGPAAEAAALRAIFLGLSSGAFSVTAGAR